MTMTGFANRNVLNMAQPKKNYVKNASADDFSWWIARKYVILHAKACEIKALLI